LSTQIHEAVPVQKDSVEIFRNVGTPNTTVKVNGVQAGWRFENPYYISIVEISNPNGLAANFGDKEIIVDSSIYSGNSIIPAGLHEIKIHKDNWFPVGIFTTLDTLKSADKFFPFNQKLLIEGYPISDILNPYNGVSLYAGYYMKEVAITDFLFNISPDDYSKFAIDYDAANPVAGKDSNMVFVVKSNENSSDFLDEKFTIRFDVIDQLYKYFWLKAELSSLSAGETPILEEYSLRLQ
jgi:hypothetical protein